MKDRLIIIPCYNERRNLPGLWRMLRQSLYCWDVLIVNDGSTDGAEQWLADSKAPHLNLPFNLGIGGAMHAGYRWAYEHGYSYALQMDGDGQHPPGELERLFCAMTSSNADMVIGSRFVTHKSYDPGFARYAGIIVLRRLIKLLTGQSVTDPTSGFRLINARLLALFAEDYPSDYPEVDTVVQALCKGLKVYEAPVRMHRRCYGRTSISPLKSAYYMLKVPFSMYLRKQSIRMEQYQ